MSAMETKDHRVILKGALECALFRRRNTMVSSRMDVLAALRKRIEDTDPDMLRSLVHGVVELLMGAEADTMCGADFGERSPDRTNHRNGCRRSRETA